MRTALLVAIVALACAQAACDRKAAEAPAAAAPASEAPTTQSGEVPASGSGIVGVKPAAEDHAASSTGPSDGAAAVGGMAGGAGTGADASPNKGNTPDQTAGDGAASAASR